jgi:hypothetical protein
MERATRRLREAAMLVCASLLLFACTRLQATDGDNPTGTNSSTAPVSARCAGTGQDDVGCPCPTPGAKLPCWPGDPALRGRGDCKDGVQICGTPKSGESFDSQTWGACQGYTIGTLCVGPCTPSEFQGCTMPGTKDHLTGVDGGGVGGPGGGSDGGPGGTGTGTHDGGMCTAQCIPGASRWCDDPVYCNWGKQTCAADGRWGKCTEVSSAPPGCGGASYNQGCCVKAGQCCEDLSGGGITIDFDGGIPGIMKTDKSVGNCANIVPMCY